MTIEIRDAGRDDLEAVNVLRRQVNDLHVQGRPDIFRPGFGPDLEAHLLEQFESDQAGVIVAVADGRIAGFAVVQYICRPQSAYSLARSFYRVEEFGVDAAFRRRGIATLLMKYLREDARRLGFNRIELDVWAFNESALAFYTSVGFTTYRRYMELEIQEDCPCEPSM